MPILTQDIKLLKSAVMADTTDGGGQMTGLTVIDGQSNNLLPDTSAMDRAFGRVNLRKVFGVAHTSDTDTLMGAHAILTEGPADPLVHCALIKTAGWADTRAAAREAIEKYLVKGPKAGAQIYDTHYAGSLQLRLITFVNAAFPAGGDAIVVRNPNGTEQFVRILKTAVVTQQVALDEGSGTITIVTAQICTCDLGQMLAMDVYGPPAARTFSANAFASLYTTTVSGGAKFYGIKPLGQPGAVNDYSVTTSDGIYTPIVPAATSESPIIDQYPMSGRSALGVTALAAVTLPTVVAVLGPNTVLTLPTAVEPGSLSIVHGGVTFTDTGASLMQGGVDVGTVDHRLGLVTLSSSAPAYGSLGTAVTYRPATRVGASVFTASFDITLANQGLSFTNVFEPPPAPGSFTLAYMAQGRWYELRDNLSGKLAGADSSYGVGNINYNTGSMGVTLGAIPDVGSPLLADWGDRASAKALTGAMPTRVAMSIGLNSRAKALGITVAWSRGTTNYTAVTDGAGVLNGDADGQFAYGVLRFEPDVFPDGDVQVTSQLGAVSYNAFTGGANGDYTLTGAVPIAQGTFLADVLMQFPSNAIYPQPIATVWDQAGVLYISYQGDARPIGTINYATGAVHINTTFSCSMFLSGSNSPSGWQAGAPVAGWYTATASVDLYQSNLTAVTYAAGAPVSDIQTITPSAWVAKLPTLGASLAQTDLVVSLGGEVYSASVGSLRKGWDVATGAPAVVSAGTVNNTGQISITSLPANGTNALVVINAAKDASAKAVTEGVFRTASAPLKTGVMQLQAGSNVGNANGAGVISGGNFTGTVDFQRGVVKWVFSPGAIAPSDLSYNAVFLQYLPLDGTLLGLETARLPLDGRVPIFRSGDLVVVHNTLSTVLPNPLVKGTAYDLGRQRLASVRVKDVTGLVVPDTLYTMALNTGLLTVPVGSSLTGYAQPFTVEHRIEDMLVCTEADISGRLKFQRSLTHAFPAATSFVSSALAFGDLFARAYNVMEQQTWTAVWSDDRIGNVITAQFNATQYPILVTNRGAIKERWAMIFTNSGTYRIVGESVGEIGIGTTVADSAPNNPATNTPYFILPALGWGNGWAAGNVLRINTDACGAPFWAVRTVLQGPASIDSDKFTLAFRGDVDRP